MKAGDGRKFYTPVVRSIASRQGISEAELSNIQGSGEGGRVTKRDVEAFIASRGRVQRVESKPAAQPVSAGPDQEIIVLTGMRKAIAEAMVKAHQIPAVSTICEVDCSRMVAFRNANKQSFQEMYGVKMTYTPFFVKAAAEALLEVPQVNSAVMDDGRVIQNRGVHMGIAVALGDGSQGLIVPVLRDCHNKTVIEIAKALDELVLKARESRLALDDLQGATFSITNPGTYGALFGTPMIPPHQGGILGTYAIKETPVAMDGMIAIRPIMHLVLSYDHRIIDGMVAGRFLKSVRDRLESFDFFR
jgi:pyruvate/2-oxoglutarate dehydrogenase complex dihydrolipoamide acyltransferase (E2) component